MLNKIAKGILAGTMISIGGTVFLSLAETSKIAGAIFFSVALLCICMQGYSLYTGKIGFILSDHSKDAMGDIWFGLLGNIIATVVFGIALGYAIPNIVEAAKPICESKLEQEWLGTLIRSVFCGMLMYQAVSIYKKQEKNVFGILFCVPVFILSGFEHSIANMFYFSAAGMYSFDVIIYMLIVLVGNSIGGIFFELLTLPFNKNKKAEESGK